LLSTEMMTGLMPAQHPKEGAEYRGLQNKASPLQDHSSN